MANPETPFEMISAEKSFILDVSPQKMPPALQGQVIADSDTLSISLKAFKGKTPGVITVELFGFGYRINFFNNRIFLLNDWWSCFGYKIYIG